MRGHENEFGFGDTAGWGVDGRACFAATRFFQTAGVVMSTRMLLDALCLLLCLACALWVGLMFTPADCGGPGTLTLLLQLLLFAPLYLLALALLTLQRPHLNRLLALAVSLPAWLMPYLPPSAARACDVVPPDWLGGVMLVLGALAWGMPLLRRRYG